ncbi:DUF6520 family protein [Flavobacterium sp. 102]|uniref:DUF6520 family protein n=1 Tax=Flavobacterium sp. 102 TaxID=2135623 RepID=UPI000EB12E41|nr:DUF6520 family protein [Flavobacterium sp. 102]RKS03037.1 hypothetical protein C8C84_2777 [Flavobacterium sp. 102]
MKTNFFKKLMMPLAVMVLGIATAFTTTSMSSTKALVPVQGYKFISQADPCHIDAMCSNVVSVNLCTSGSSQLWGKVTPNAPTCDVKLYRP